MANAVDYAADDAWVLVEDFGQAITYTPVGAAARAINANVKPEDSNRPVTDGWQYSVRRIQVTAASADFDPQHGDKIVYGGLPWDFASIAQDPTCGQSRAFFEHLIPEIAGAVGVAPI